MSHVDDSTEISVEIAPDWTYSELVEAVVSSHANGIEKTRKSVERGLYAVFPVKFLAIQSEDAPRVTMGMQITPEDRVWCIDEDGMKEIGYSGYSEQMKEFVDDRRLQITYCLSRLIYRFEDNRYCYLRSSMAMFGGDQVSTCKYQIVRADDGRIGFKHLETIGRS